MHAYHFTPPQSLQQAQALDAQDPLAPLAARFNLPQGVIYLDGNSLGALPKGVAARITQAIEREWGEGLIRSWNDADWYPAPLRVGKRIAQLIGAREHEVAVCDSTSVNLFKVVGGALQMQLAKDAKRRVVLCESDNFPTDAYICEGVAQLMGAEMVMAPQHEIPSKIIELGEHLAVVALTHVNYKSGRMYDMAAITVAAHKAGALMVWDLAHSAGAIDVDLTASNTDFAVGCGYKYLNGGPGAPAFVMIRQDHIAGFKQPLQGWHGHSAPFAFTPDYAPHQGIDRMLVGTAAQLSLIALEEALKAFDGVSMQALRAKSMALTQCFFDLCEHELAGMGFGMASPARAEERGSQVSLTHEQGYAIVQALIARGLIGDFRAPNILRFGFAPLYVSFTDTWNAVQHIKQVMQSGEWNQPKFLTKKAVT